MRYVILGAGAIGATIGGRLAEGGCDVTLVGRGEHAAAVQRNGLVLAMPDGVSLLPIPMLTMDQLRLSAADVLILAVKSQDTAQLLNQLAAIGVEDGVRVDDLPVFCAQNGIANEDAALRCFSRVYGVCVNVPATHVEPGVIEAAGSPVSGVLQLGRYPAGPPDDLVHSVAADLSRCGLTSSVHADVMPWKRAKLLSNLANALQVLCTGGLQRRAAAGGGAVGEVMARLRAEASACFTAAGWIVTDAQAYRAETSGFEVVAVGGRPRSGGSTWQSVERGLPTVETDFLNGEVVRLGRLHGVPTPVNAAVQARMREITRRSLTPRSLEPADLLVP
jgi:2-dehydropantoate 2-reductase